MMAQRLAPNGYDDLCCPVSMLTGVLTGDELPYITGNVLVSPGLTQISRMNFVGTNSFAMSSVTGKASVTGNTLLSIQTATRPVSSGPTATMTIKTGSVADAAQSSGGILVSAPLS